MTSLLTGLVLAATLSLPPRPPADVTLVTSQNRPMALSTFRGRPTILMYGGKNTQHLNDAFDHELVVRLEKRVPQPPVYVVPVADLHDVNFWPLRNIALGKVREVERTHRIPVLVDWNQAMTTSPWKLPPGQATVILLDAGGTPVFRHTGLMGPSETEELFARLNALLDSSPSQQQHAQL